MFLCFHLGNVTIKPTIHYYIFQTISYFLLVDVIYPTKIETVF